MYKDNNVLFSNNNIQCECICLCLTQDLTFLYVGVTCYLMLPFLQCIQYRYSNILIPIFVLCSSCSYLWLTFTFLFSLSLLIQPATLSTSYIIIIAIILILHSSFEQNSFIFSWKKNGLWSWRNKSFSLSLLKRESEKHRINIE